jgi:hypothetical protein
LSLSQDEFLTLLFDNVDIAHGLFRMAFRSGSHGPWRGVSRGLLPDLVVSNPEDGLQPMERALLLQSSPLSAGATSAQLMRLALIAAEIPIVAGEALAGDGDEPAIFLVVSGSIALEAPDGAAATAGPGDAIGLYETLADVRTAGRVVGRTAGRALRIQGHELFELLSTDVELLQGLFATVLRLDAAAGVQSAAPVAGLQAV